MNSYIEHCSLFSYIFPLMLPLYARTNVEMLYIFFYLGLCCSSLRNALTLCMYVYCSCRLVNSYIQYLSCGPTFVVGLHLLWAYLCCGPTFVVGLHLLWAYLCCGPTFAVALSLLWPYI